MWESFDKLFNYIYKGDEIATKLSKDLLTLVHTWDDLIDKDKPVEDNEINRAFIIAIFDLGSNPYFTEAIKANFYNVYLRWNDANDIEADEKATDNQLAMAWMLRAGLYDLFVLIAGQLYGRQWAEEIGVLVRNYYGEPLEGFIEEVRNA